MRLGLVLAVGAQPLPQERRRVEPDDVDAVVGQREQHAEHRAEDLGVGPVEVPLELVERRPHPLVRSRAAWVKLPGAMSGNTSGSVRS